MRALHGEESERLKFVIEQVSHSVQGEEEPANMIAGKLG